MPLLPKENDIFPESLFLLPPEEFPWTVAHVRSRQEKVLARYLMEQDVPFYLPIVEQERRRSGRTFRSFLPLFPGYVFVRPSRIRRELIWRSNVTANLIDVPDQEQLAEELQQIRRLQLAGASFEPFDELLPGDPVQITEGVFSGYRGVVARSRGGNRLVVTISLLRQSVTVEFGRKALERQR